MANRYWVTTGTTGGTGNWNDTQNWSATSGGAAGASVPGAADQALFDAASGSGTATLDISPTIQVLNMTGFTGTLAFGINTISVNSTGAVFTGSTAMTVTGTPLIILTNATATSRSLSPTAVTETNSISFRVTGGTGTLTLNAGSYRDLDFTDGVNPTGYAGALAGGQVISVYGNFKASTGMSQTAGTGGINFVATSGTKTINTAGVTFDRPFTFNGVGGTWQLQAALTSGATRACTLTNGTLDLNGYTLTTGTFNGNNANTRTLAFGTGNITLTGNNATIWTTNNSSNLTVTGTPTINATYSGSTGTRTILGPGTGASEDRSFNVNVTTASDTVSFNNQMFKDITLTGFTGAVVFSSTTAYGSVNISAGATSVTGALLVLAGSASGPTTFTTNGNTIGVTTVRVNALGRVVSFVGATNLTGTLSLLDGTLKLPAGLTTTVGAFLTGASNLAQRYLQSTTAGVQATLSQASGIVNAAQLTLQDSNATGGAVFNAPTGSQNVDAGNNTGWNFASGGGSLTPGKGMLPVLRFGFKF